MVIFIIHMALFSFSSIKQCLFFQEAKHSKESQGKISHLEGNYPWYRVAEVVSLDIIIFLKSINEYVIFTSNSVSIYRYACMCVCLCSYAFLCVYAFVCMQKKDRIRKTHLCEEGK